MADSDLVKCVKVTRPESHGDKFFCAYRIEDFSAADEFDGADPGERIVLEYVEMSLSEVNALPDFPGW